MLWYVMSCHVMSCYVMSCHVMSCHVMLCYVMLCYAAIFKAHLTGDIQRRCQRDRLEKRKVLRHLRELVKITGRIKFRSDGGMSFQSTGPGQQQRGAGAEKCLPGK